jgi:hypothetical protein
MGAIEGKKANIPVGELFKNLQQNGARRTKKMRRHSVKEKETRFALSKFESVARKEDATRIEKIEALQACGYPVNRKTRKDRVDAIFSEVAPKVMSTIYFENAKRRARNIRKRARRRAA